MRQDEPQQHEMFGYVPAMTQCGLAACGKIIPLRQATVSVYHITDHVSDQDHFCCDDHALQAWRERYGGQYERE